jgi:hypothetical protein
MFFFKTNYPYNTLMFREWDLFLMSFLGARRVRTDMRRKAGVGASGGQLGSGTNEGRSLDDN